MDDWDLAARESISTPPPRSTEVPTLDLSFAVAQFCHFYPGEFQNGKIGWKRFWILYDQLHRISAIHRYNTTLGTRLGVGVFEVADSGRHVFEREIKKDFDLARGL